MQAVSTMSTRQAMAARKNSKDVSVRPKAINARSRPMRGAMTFQPNITRNIALSADGRRAVQVLTTPPLNISENTAMSQASNGGLYGMSPPQDVGSIQSPLLSIDTATIASRGSPLLLNHGSPSHGSSSATAMIVSMMVLRFMSSVYGGYACLCVAVDVMSVRPFIRQCRCLRRCLRLCSTDLPSDRRRVLC